MTGDDPARCVVGLVFGNRHAALARSWRSWTAIMGIARSGRPRSTRPMMRPSIRQFVAGLLCAMLLAGGAAAQTDPSGDPPTRVGRLSEVEGVVSFHAGDQTQWSPAAINLPVTGGSSFWTEPSARAALQVGPAIIRLASQTEFDVVALDDHNFQGQIGQGAVNLRLYALPQGDAFQIV